MANTIGTGAREYLTQRSLFRAWTRVPVRYFDLDPLGHVNNTAMAVYLEEARCQMITALLKAHNQQLDMVLAATAIDYRHELNYPGEVEIGTIAKHVGSKSFTFAHGVFQGERCAGTAEVVLVFFDLQKRASVAPPADVRELLEGLLDRA